MCAPEGRAPSRVRSDKTMNRRLTLNLVLAGVIIALALVVIFEPGKEKTPEQPKITLLPVEAVTRIEVERVNHDTLKFEKQGEHWRITQPLNLPANDFRVASVARIVQATSFGHFSAAGRDLKQYELDAPSVRVHLADLVIEFGGINPLDKRRYVRVGDMIHLTSDDSYFRLTGDAHGFVSTALIPEHAADLTEIKLPKMTVRSDAASGKWVVTPEIANLSADDINKFVDEWRHAQSLAVSAYSGTPTGDVVTLNFRNNVPAMRLDVMTKDGDLMLGNKAIGVQYQFSSDSRDRLFTLTPAPPPTADKEALPKSE